MKKRKMGEDPEEYKCDCGAVVAEQYDTCEKCKHVQEVEGLARQIFVARASNSRGYFLDKPGDVAHCFVEAEMFIKVKKERKQ